MVRQLEQGPPFDAPIEMRVTGPNPQQLRTIGDELRRILSETPRVLHTRSDIAETIPKLLVRLDSQQVSTGNLSEASVTKSLSASLEGAPAGTLVSGEEELTVKVRLADQNEFALARLTSLPMTSVPSRSANRGRAASQSTANPPLASIVDFRLGAEAAAIVRIGGKRVNEVKAYIEAGVLPSQVLADFRQRLASSEFCLPTGYELSFGGETAERSHAVETLIANSGVLFSLMVLSLVVSFRSFRCAAIILAVGTLCVGLGPLSLWWFGYPFGFMAIVGTMGLVGVAINDSIVVLAAIRDNALARRGSADELVRVVVQSTRHIVATTVTTIVGFMPLVLGGGGFWPPLAVTVTGGVAAATFLALYFVPSLHLLLYGQNSTPVNQRG